MPHTNYMETNNMMMAMIYSLFSYLTFVILYAAGDNDRMGELLVSC